MQIEYATDLVFHPWLVRWISSYFSARWILVPIVLAASR